MDEGTCLQAWQLNNPWRPPMQASEPSSGSSGTTDCSACTAYLAAFKVTGRVAGSSIMPLLPAQWAVSTCQSKHPPSSPASFSAAGPGCHEGGAAHGSEHAQPVLQPGR